MTPINCITVVCDTKKMQTIRIACRCGKQWTEKIPQELHDSELIAQFECTQCHRFHLLRNHQLISMSKEEFHDRFDPQTTFTASAKRTGEVEYDA